MSGLLQDMIVIVDGNRESDNQNFLIKISDLVDRNLAIVFSRYIRKRNKYEPISLDEIEFEDCWICEENARMKRELKNLPQKCQARIASLGSYLPETLPAGEP